jgi:putative ABC transport system ATP-binding protein
MHEAATNARCEDLTRVYWTETERVEALKGVTASFPAAAVSAVVGPSGSGKSTLLRILAGLDRPTSGRVQVGGVDITGLPGRALRKLRRGLVGYVFQRPADNFISYLTVAEHLDLAARRASGGGHDGFELLKQLGLENRVSHYPHQLSGGEQQRAAFAQVLVARPALVVADEPTAELDSTASAEVLHAVQTLVERGTAFILATHDPQVAAVAEEILEFHDGVIVGLGGDDRRWQRPR